jgi:photosystem II stability/assembly factor-like uncharacterized protein
MKARVRLLARRLLWLTPLFLSLGCHDRGWLAAPSDTQSVLPIQAYAWERLPLGTPPELTLGRLRSDGRRLWVVGDTVVLRSGDGGRSWETLHPGVAERLYAVYARGAGVWVAGDRGTIVHSDDGGVSWDRQTSGTDEAINSLVGDGQRLWAVGANGTVLHSEHGGLEWRRQDSGTHHELVGIAGAGDTLWIIGQAGVILHSENGGDGWRVQPSNTAVNLVGIHRDGERLWVMGQDGTLLRSEDGGEHWRAETGLRDQLATDDADLVAIAGVGSRLWAASEDKGFYSADGGREWHTLPNAPGGGGGASELDASGFQDVLVDGDQVLLLGTWTEPTPGPGKGLQGRYAVFRGSTGRSFAYLVLESWRVSSRPPVTRLELHFKPHPRGESSLEAPRMTFGVTGADPGDEADGYFRRIDAPFDTVAPLTWMAELRPATQLHAGPGDSLTLRVTTYENGFRETYPLRFVYLPWWERGLLQGRQHPVGVVLLVGLFAALLVFALRPGWLLYAGRVQESEDLGNIPVFGKAVHGLLWVVRWLTQWPRVLDAWVAAHADAAGEQTVLPRDAGLAEVPLKSLWTDYVELPISLDRGGRNRVGETPAELGALLPSRGGTLEIVGPAGSGKTMLAAKIAQWALASVESERMWGQRVFPVFVDENTDDLLATLSGRLTSLLQEEVPRDLVRTLLVRKRLLVIVDGLSERDAKTQAHLDRVRRGIARGFLLIVTARRRLEVEGGTIRELYPRPLADPETIRLLVERLLQSTPVPPECADGLAELCRRLATEPGPDGAAPGSLSPLLVRMVVERAAELWERAGTLDEMRGAVYEVYRDYLERVRPPEAERAWSPVGKD